MNLNDLEHIKTPESWKEKAKDSYRPPNKQKHASAVRPVLITAALLVLLCGTALAAANGFSTNDILLTTQDELDAIIEESSWSEFPIVSSGAPSEDDDYIPIPVREFMESRIWTAESWSSLDCKEMLSLYLPI